MGGDPGTADGLTEHLFHGAVEQVLESTTNHRAVQRTVTTGQQPHPDRHPATALVVRAAKEARTMKWVLLSGTVPRNNNLTLVENPSSPLRYNSLQKRGGEW